MDRRFFDELLSTYVTRLHTDISDHLSSFNLPAVTYVHNGQQAVNRPVVILEFDSIDQEITLFSLGHLSIIDLGTAMRDERLAAGARMDTFHDTALGALGADFVVVVSFPMIEDFTSWPVIKVIRLWREVEVNEKFGHRHIMIKGTGVV
ncbi:hypothetical protein MPER_01024 [Moniliophthora perniciosa FA553]|nr:hypothetical protein MPER_01024 [Moniliophthora perniciosa FA553]